MITHQRWRRQEFQRAQEVARVLSGRRSTRRLPCLRAERLCRLAACRMLPRPCCTAGRGGSCIGRLLAVLEAAAGQLHAGTGESRCQRRRLREEVVSCASVHAVLCSMRHRSMAADV